MQPEVIRLTTGLNKEELEQFLSTKHLSPKTIKRKICFIHRVDRENLMIDDVWTKYANYSPSLKNKLWNAIRLSEESNEWEKE